MNQDVVESNQKKIGVGYWSLTAVDRRIAALIEKKPRRWNKKLKALKAARKAILALPKPTRIVKGWKSYTERKQRALKMRQLHRRMSYSEVGKMFGISRQRVHQICSQ